MFQSDDNFMGAISDMRSSYAKFEYNNVSKI